MPPVWDYIGFAVWFAGLGYIVLSLFGSADAGLPPLLHVLGLAAAISVPLRGLFFLIDRRRRTDTTSASRARKPDSVLRSPPQRPSRVYPTVKPRNHFGLRGTPD